MDVTSNADLTISPIANNEVSNLELEELRKRAEQSHQTSEVFKEQIVQLNNKLNDMTNLYETTSKTLLEEKNKLKQSDRSLKTLKSEKDNLLTVSS